MARIRNIKPEFFDDDELARVSRDARLLFIGLWTQADREGRLEDRAERLRVRLFPYDQDITATKLDKMLADLARNAFINRYIVKGQHLIQIRTFTKHQYISKREPDSELPDESQADSVESETSPRPVLDESQPGTTDIGHRTRDKGQEVARLLDEADEEIRLTVDALGTLWNATTAGAGLATVTGVRGARKTHAAARLTERPDPAWWAEFFRRIAASDFLCGRVPPTPGRKPFRCTFDWMLLPTNFDKILGGNYDNAHPSTPPAEVRMLVYTCPECGELHFGPDPKAHLPGVLYQCDHCGKPHQGPDPTKCLKGKAA